MLFLMSIGPIRRREKGRKQRQTAFQPRLVTDESGQKRLVFGARPKVTRRKEDVWSIAFDLYPNLNALLAVHPFVSHFKVMRHVLSRYDDLGGWLDLNQRLDWAPTVVVRWCEERARQESKGKRARRTTWTKAGELRCSLAFLGTGQRGNYAVRDRNGGWWFVFARKDIEDMVRREVLNVRELRRLPSASAR